MKTRLQWTVLSVLILFPLYTSAQLIENFETGSKGGYATANVTLSSGSWTFTDALIGTAANDRKNGSQSVRIRDGYVQMNFDKPDGAAEISFYAADAGFSGDGGASLQLFISTDGGANWQETGDEISLTSTLQQYAFNVNQDGNIRIKIEKSSGDDEKRVNVDDVLITDFEEILDEPTLRVRMGNEQLVSDATLDFGVTVTSNEVTRTISLRNQGIEDLEITDVNISGNNFSTENTLGDPIESQESESLTISFIAQDPGQFSETLTISTNDPEQAEFTLTLAAEVLDTSQPMPISEARTLDFGTVVTITGWVTVGDEFSGPAFIQDETAGMAIFFAELHDNVSFGDSVLVTGPLTEFNPIGGTPGDFLMQIAASDEHTVTFEIFQDGHRQIEPTSITIQEMNSGAFESQLVQIDNVTINHTGAFQGNTNYDITDGTADAFIRIDNSVTELVGAEAPQGATNIVGVIDQFNGDYQLKPRSAEDLGVESIELPYQNVPKSETFDIVTWNIEWFGSSSQGPDDVELQMENVKNVITTIDADLYAVQEIANINRFNELMDDLEDYRGFLANYSQTQKTGYIFRHTVIDSIDSGFITTGQTESDWAGRLPLMFEFDVTIGDETRRITTVNIHAKAFADASSYQQRVNASEQIKSYFDGNLVQSNLIFLGDYNDDVLVSTFDNQPSPYQNFVDDTQAYHIITKSLSERGFTSYRSMSNIDHITITTPLVQYYLEGTERIENPNYIGSYLSTTSDHFPVWTRFAFTELNDEGGSETDTYTHLDDELPSQLNLAQNYPNPFNPTTSISFDLPEQLNVSLHVYDIMGRRVATLLQDESKAAGSHQVSFDASNLASGMYLYRLQTQNGAMLTRTMMLIK